MTTLQGRHLGRCSLTNSLPFKQCEAVIHMVLHIKLGV